MDKIRRVTRRLTDEERLRHRQALHELEPERRELDAKALAKKAELESLRRAFRQLAQQRVHKGMTVEDVAAESGLDASLLAELEREPHPVLSWDILFRVARSLGAEVRVGVVGA